MIVLGEAFPFRSSMHKTVPRCVHLCATASVQVIGREERNRAEDPGVIDGESPTAVECEEDVSARLELLKRFGYKR